MSNQGEQHAVLTATITITVTDVEAAMQEASSLNSKMTTAPNDPADQLQPALAIGTAVSQNGLCVVLERLDGFMRLADLAAEVSHHYSMVLSDRMDDITWTTDAGPSVGQARMGSCVSGIYSECSQYMHCGYPSDESDSS